MCFLFHLCKITKWLCNDESSLDFTFFLTEKSVPETDCISLICFVSLRKKILFSSIENKKIRIAFLSVTPLQSLNYIFFVITTYSIYHHLGRANKVWIGMKYINPLHKSYPKPNTRS